MNDSLDIPELKRLHAAYGSELTAGLKPEEEGDTNAQR